MTRYEKLYDSTWLRQRAESGVTPSALASEVGCGETTARTALARYGLPTSSQMRRLGEPSPRPLEVAPADPADLSADVADDELSERLREGLVGLSRLADVADRSTSDAMWDLVVGIDPNLVAILAELRAALAVTATAGVGRVTGWD